MTTIFRGMVNILAITGLGWFAGQISWCAIRTRVFPKSSPGGLAIAKNKDGEALFIADFWGNRFASPETGEITRFPPPSGVTASSNIALSDRYYALASIWPFGIVYFVDRETNELVKTIPVGAPYYMVFMEDGSLLVADYKNNHLLMIAPGESRDKKIVADQLNGPVGLALAGDDTVYVSEYNTGQVRMLSLVNGARELIVGDLQQPEGLVLDREGRLIIAETGGDRLRRIMTESGSVEVIAENIPMGLAGGDDMPEPFLLTGVTVDRDNRIYVSSDLENAVYRLTPR